MRIGRRRALAATAAFGATLVGGTKRGRTELWIGGDVELGDGHARFEGLDRVLDGAAGMVNLEGPVGSRGGLVWNAPQGLASLRAAGVRVAGIANNHALDRGAEGLAATRAALDAAGILTADRARLDGVTITAHDLGEGLPDHLAAELAGAVVATFHVTGPPSYLPRPPLREAVDLALAAGALVVAAHGSHALGPIERRGRAVIAWGLGNLIFDCDCTREIDGAILRVSIDGGEVAARVVPIDAGLRGAPARPAHDPGLILDLFEALGSSPFGRDGDSAIL
jgi:hypothetical protein